MQMRDARMTLRWNHLAPTAAGHSPTRDAPEGSRTIIIPSLAAFAAQSSLREYGQFANTRPPTHHDSVNVASPCEMSHAREASMIERALLNGSRATLPNLSSASF